MVDWWEQWRGWWLKWSAQDPWLSSVSTA